MSEVIYESKRFLNDGGPFGIERVGITWENKWGKQISFIAEFIFPGDDEEFKAVKTMLHKWAAAEIMHEALRIVMMEFRARTIVRDEDKMCEEYWDQVRGRVEDALNIAEGK